MAANETAILAALVSDNEQRIMPEWLESQKQYGTLQTGRITGAELASQSSEFLHLLRRGLASGGVEIASGAYNPAREFLGNLSRSRALQGFSPTETATFVFSLKQPLFNTLNRDKSLAPADLAKVIWTITILLDELGLFTFELQHADDCPHGDEHPPPDDQLWPVAFFSRIDRDGVATPARARRSLLTQRAAPRRVQPVSNLARERMPSGQGSF
jgi:hypothetical protein